MEARKTRTLVGYSHLNSPQSETQQTAHCHLGYTEEEMHDSRHLCPTQHQRIETGESEDGHLHAADCRTRTNILYIQI